MKQIDIDLDVNRAIENGRIRFDENHNTILRRLLVIDGRATPLLLRDCRAVAAPIRA